MVVALLIVAALGGLAWDKSRELPRRFGVVEEGRLYRSGRVTPEQLQTLHEKYGVRTVLSLLNPDVPESQKEREAAQKLGMRWINIPLTGDGASTPEDRGHIRSILADERNGPLLVHCAAGANRTGLAVGMYRLYHDGWSLDQVRREMLDYGFENEPQHENLRAALAEEAKLAAEAKKSEAKP